jgi:hypothetical protein
MAETLSLREAEVSIDIHHVLFLDKRETSAEYNPYSDLTIHDINPLTNEDYRMLTLPTEELPFWEYFTMIPTGPFGSRLEEWQSLVKELGIPKESLPEILKIHDELMSREANDTRVDDKGETEVDKLVVTHLDPFIFSSLQKQGIVSVRKANVEKKVDLRIVSATEIGLGARFRDYFEKEGIWGDISSAMFRWKYKPVVLSKLLGYVANHRRAQAKGRPHYIVEDRLDMGTVLAYLLNAEIHIPLSERVARSQPQAPLPVGLLDHRMNGNLIFYNSGIPEVYERLLIS